MRHGIRPRGRPGPGLRVLETGPWGRLRHSAFIIIHSVLIVVGFVLFVLAEFSYITYHLGVTHFLLAHLVAEVCDALALVLIAVGYTRRSAPLVAGAGQHR